MEYYYDRGWAGVGESNGTQNGKTGQLTRIVDNKDRNRDKIYEYDALGRLRTVRGGAATGFSGLPANWTQSYVYDRWGNRTNVNVAPNSVTSNNQAVPTDGIANLSYQQTSNRINTTDYEYDPAGNLVKGQAADGSWQRYQYDAANRFGRCFDNANNSLQGSGYTSSNRRLVTNDAEGLKWYVWGGDSVMAEYTSAGWANALTWQKSYIYAGDSLLSTYTNNGSGGETTEFHHPDRLGTKLVTNHQANNSFEQSTLPFGTSLTAEESGTSTTNRKFTSYQRSNVTKLDYAVNRSYSSAQGRFTQVDPIGMSAASLIAPQTLNMYSYCGNDPINRTDPSGLFFGKLFRAIGKIFKIIVIALAILVAVAAVIAIQEPMLRSLAIKALVWASTTLVSQFVGGKIGAVLQIATNLYFSGPKIIVNLASTLKKLNKVAENIICGKFGWRSF
ncbi:MAG: RHS repeat-associated core domain-containing protein [Blastocatellia bacterium]|nr:RHS repeat-associated core domain-containing protein [Blastocatellia bacterium]